MRTVIYPGTFDPITNGHMDLITRATILFARVIVAVAKNEDKHPLFAHEERIQLVKETTKNLQQVEVEGFDGLLVDYAKKKRCHAVLRGLRAVSDFEFEFQLALMNRKLDKDFETIFMMPNEEYTFLSSRMVKEIAKLGGNISPFVPPHVAKALRKKLGFE
ncbi:MAG: pantetheine-phosphate adenylyltransferase [Verrucomicrobiae bacterium]|nr:pantetheine-phosphate adenylyltransferase [Verrucomicrobiae bacterium]